MERHPRQVWHHCRPSNSCLQLHQPRWCMLVYHNINRSSTKVHSQRWHSLGRSSIESMTIGVSPLNGTYPYQCLDCKVKTRHQSKWSLTWSLCWMWTRQKTSLILTLRYGRSIKPLRVCGTVPLTLQLGEYTLMYTLNLFNLFRYCIQ